MKVCEEHVTTPEAAMLFCCIVLLKRGISALKFRSSRNLWYINCLDN